MAKRALFGLLGCFFLLSAIGFAGDDGASHVSVHCWDDAPVIIHPAPLQIQVLPFAPTDKFAKLVVRNTGSQPITAVILWTRHIGLNGHTLYGTDSSDFTSYGDPLNPGEQTQIEIGTAASANHALAELEISCEAALLEGVP